MKSEFLKIAGVKTEKQFYAKFPDEKSFFKAHPEAKKLIKKAQVGTQVDGNGNGIPDYLEGVQPIQGPQNRITLPKAPIAQGEPETPSIPGIQPYTKSIEDTISENRQITEASPLPGAAPLNKASFADKAAPYIGAAQSIIGGIGALDAQQKEKMGMRQMRRVTDLQRIASGTREEDPERRYVKPWDVTVQPNQMFPTYGVGTNVLTAQDGAEIQNTYAPGTLYDNLGYEPLNDSDQVKQYAYGGYIPQAQSGFSKRLNNSGFGQFMSSEGGGQALGMLTGALNNNSAESQIGSGIGTAAGTAIGGPVGGMIGGALGGLAGGLFNTSQKSIKRDREAINRNINTIMGNQLGQSMQNQYSSYVKDGGNIPGYEEGGWVSHDWQPQLITKFGDHTAQDVYDFAHEGMDTLRSGGHLKSDYTPVSNRGLQTYAMGGELQTHWGGNAETMSYNPYLPDGGETVMFRGQSHDESDGKGNTGIGITFGNSPVEVERGEPAVKLKDGTSGEENLTVYGNLQIPNEYVPLLGDPKAKGKKFKNYIAEISKDESKQNKIVEKSTDELNNLDLRSPFDKLKFDALSANINGANMKLKSIADKKMNAAALQNAINDTAEEHGLVADDLAKGKVKFDKEALQEYAEYGKSISKAQDGKTTVEPSPLDEVVITPTKKSESSKATTTNPRLTKEQYQELQDAYIEAKADQKNKTKVEAFQKLFHKYFPKEAVNIIKEAGKTRGITDKGKALGLTKEELEKGENTSKILGSNEEGYFGPRTEQYWKVATDAYNQPSSTPDETKKTDDKKKEDKRYATTPYKRSTVMDIANQILPFIRPTDQEPLDPRQLMGEMYALSTNQLEPVQAQGYQPELATPYDISLQDQLNANQADFNAMQRMIGYNPAAASQLAAQKYAANEKVLGEQFRMNQAMRMGVYDENRKTLNDAKLKNLAIYDQQYERQAQAKSNTKAITQAALNSIADKYAKNRLENRELGIYENLYNYRYDPSGRAINMNPLYQPNMPTVYAKQTDPNMIPVKDAQGNIIEYRSIYPTENSTATPPYVQIGSRTTDTTTTQAPTTSNKFGGAIKKYAKNGSIVKAYKNI